MYSRSWSWSLLDEGYLRLICKEMEQPTGAGY